MTLGYDFVSQDYVQIFLGLISMLLIAFFDLHSNKLLILVFKQKIDVFHSLDQ